jgi:hypothetical protein
MLAAKIRPIETTMRTCWDPRKFHGMEYKGVLIPYCCELYGEDEEEDDDDISWRPCPFC